MDADTSLQVGVLSLHNSKETKAILNAIDALGHQPEWLRRENTTVTLGEPSSAPPSPEPAVDVVINRLLLSQMDVPSQALGVAATYAAICPVVNHPAAVLRALHKFAAGAHLNAAGVAVPDSVFAFGAHRLETHRDTVTPSPKETTDTTEPSVEQPVQVPDGGTTTESSPVVHKTPISTHGDGTTKLEPDDQVPQTVGMDQGMLQELVDQPAQRSSDIRVYVVGDQVISAMRRYAPDDDWRTNVARGGTVEDVTATLPDGARETALQATQTLGLDCAGVDLVEAPDTWYVLEANPTAGFKGLFDATGTSPAPYIAQFALEQAGAPVDTAHVESLATTLDDSVPACRPPLESKPSSQNNTIGLTETVQVSGRTNSTEAVGKADTGAARTSIDTDLAAHIGAGPILDTITVKTGSTKHGATRPLVEIGVRIHDYTHTVTASIEDRSHMKYDLLLGRDILNSYSIDIGRQCDTDAAPEAALEE